MTSGETLFDVQNRIQGQCDSPLTDKGIQHAKQLKEKLKDISFQHVFVSTSERTRDTADIILDGQRFQTDDRLKDINYGELEGSSITEELNNIHYSEMGGEDHEDVKKRLIELIRDITDICEDQENVLFVSHKNIYPILMNILDRNEVITNKDIHAFEYQIGEIYE